MQSITKDEGVLKDVFIGEAIRLGYDMQEAKDLLAVLPKRLHEVKALKMGFTNEDLGWRYVFGDHFKINSKPGFGTYQMPLVSSLIRAYSVAFRRLDAKKFDIWSGKSTNPGKHYDFIVEMLAVANVPTESTLIYEQKGLGNGGDHIEWLLKDSTENILLEVKNRPGQLPTHFEKETGSTSLIPFEAVPDFRPLFRSTHKKFKLISESEYIQGAVIFLSLKVPQTPFEKYFYDNIQDRLHFVALSRLEGTHVKIVSVSEDIKNRVLSAYGWENNADLFL